MRSLWRSLLSVFLAFCIVFSNSLCALANTTTEQFYSIMPFSSLEDFSISWRTGSYNLKSDSYSWSSLRTIPVSNGSLNNSGSIEYTFPFSYDDLFAVEIQFNNIGKLSDIRALLGRVNFGFYAPDSDLPTTLFFMNKNNIQVYKSFFSAEWSGTLRNGTTHLSSTASSTGSFPSGFIQPYNAYDVFFQNLIDVTLPLEVPPPSEWENFVDASSGSGNSVYNTGVTSFKLVFVLNLNRDIQSEGGNYLFDRLSVGDLVTYRCYLGNNIAVIQSDDTNDSSGIGSVMSGLSSSISNLGSSLNTNIAQVKTQITQSTNTITTKIDTMSQDIQTGLQNVVTSAQQNTQNIINTVTTKVDEVKTGITEVKDSIIDLPNKLQDMLVGFFVPDEETINSKFAEFETLLSDRFGLIYQSADIIHDFADSLQTQAVMVADTGGIITLPSVTVNLAGVDYTFGGFDVDVIPNGFEALQTAVRLATSMVCTVVFVNMLKNKLEAILK